MSTLDKLEAAYRDIYDSQVEKSGNIEAEITSIKANPKEAVDNYLKGIEPENGINLETILYQIQGEATRLALIHADNKHLSEYSSDQFKKAMTEREVISGYLDEIKLYKTPAGAVYVLEDLANAGQEAARQLKEMGN